jgi:hypothetical protein
MEELIQKILQIESNAQDIVVSARTAQENFSADMDAQLTALRAKINAETAGKIEQLEKHEKEAADEQVAAIEADTAEKLRALDETYAAHKNEWAEAIFAGARQ